MIDAILFNDEFDLLLCRLEYLRDFADTTVIIEARQTFSGHKKELIAQRNIDVLENKSGGYVIVLEASYEYLSFENPWKIELETRRQLQSYLQSNFPNRRVLFSDLDELPSPDQLSYMKNLELTFQTGTFSIPNTTFYRYINFSFPHEFSNHFPITFVASDPPPAEKFRLQQDSVIPGNPGSHLSYLGMSGHLMTKKLSSFSHTEFQGFQDVELALLSISDSNVIDHLGRFHQPGRGLMKCIDLRDLPETNQIIHRINPIWLRDQKEPKKVQRVLASALVTYVRMGSNAPLQKLSRTINPILMANAQIELNKIPLRYLLTVFAMLRSRELLHKRHSFARYLKNLRIEFSIFQCLIYLF